jgi:DNA repair ATPase RecN
MASRGENITDYIPIHNYEECLRIEKSSRRLSLRREGIKYKKKLNKTINNIQISTGYIDLKRYSLFSRYSRYSRYGKHVNVESDYVRVYDSRYTGLKCDENRYVVTYENIYNQEEVTLQDIVSSEHEKRTIVEMLQALHLDKKIVSKEELNNLIENDSTIFNSKKVKTTAKRVVRYLNQENKSTSLCKATISSYRKRILSMGVHYLYSDVELEPIKVSRIIRAIGGDGRIDMST